MGIGIQQLTPVFAGEVSGVDIARSLTKDEVAVVEAAMDRYAVLVFHDQTLTNPQQQVFSRNFDELEHTGGGNITKTQERRLDPYMADVSNLDKDHRPLARHTRTRMFNLGNRLWHSDSSFRAVPAKYSLLSGRMVVDHGGQTQFAYMRAAYDALDAATKAEIKDLVCEHSLIYSRDTLDFSDLTVEERAMMRPVRQRLVRTHPVTGRKSLFLSSHIGTIVGWPMAEARAFIRDRHARQ
jgi:alpha-ketoglutarate-dependent 2,4-dichlorophenoxyacetate dioxygenase